VARGDLSDVEWELVEPFLPLGGRGPVPDLRRLFNAVMWRFRTGRPWRDVPQEYGSWSTVYGAFQRWAAAGTFRMLMEGMIAEAAARDQVALDLVSVDSTVARAHHHAAGMAVDPELLDELEKAVAEEKGLIERGKAHRWLRRTRTATTWCVRTTKTHLAAERRCRRLSFVLTPGQAADSPRFVPVLEGIKVRGPVGRPRTRPGAVAADKTPPAPTVPTCGDAVSAVSFRRRPTRSPTARRRVLAAAARSLTIRTCTRTATLSNAASTRSRSGGAWPPATTRPPPATSPDSTYAVP
jgi:transposase